MKMGGRFYNILSLLFRTKLHRDPMRHITNCHVHTHTHTYMHDAHIHNNTSTTADGNAGWTSLKSSHTFRSTKSRVHIRSFKLYSLNEQLVDCVCYLKTIHRQPGTTKSSFLIVYTRRPLYKETNLLSDDDETMIILFTTFSTLLFLFF